MNSQQITLSRLSPRQIERMYLDLFSSENGKIVLEDMRLRFYAYYPTHLKAGTEIEVDNNENLRNQGARNTILTIETMIENGRLPEQGDRNELDA